MKKIKVLIVDDSKLMQQVLVQIFALDKEIKVVGTASDPFIAREMIKKVNPDVLTLDIMMPHMDGLTFLRNLMRLRPMPVVMLSSLTEIGSPLALEALAIGAVDYMVKPSPKELTDIYDYAKRLITLIKNAAKANVQARPFGQTHVKLVNSNNINKLLPQADLLQKEIIAIGASTGGIEAIETILVQLPAVFPPVVVAQHIKREFSKAFSKRINKFCDLNIVEAKQGEEVLPGHVYIAVGGLHLTIKQRNGRFFCVLNDSEEFNGHKPSIDILFSAVAEVAGANSIGILLTGMGTDGAQGLKEIHDAGGVTIAQDKDTSVVWGMPGAAVKLNAVDHVLPIQEIPEKILHILDAKAQQRR